MKHKSIRRRVADRARANWNIRRPFLESLEDRTLLATMLWSNSSGGDWDVTSNWVNQANSSDHHVPTATDDAQINTAGITVTHSAGTSDSVNELTVASGTTLNISGGTLAIAADSTIAGNLTMTGGTITPAGLTVTGSVNWSGGTISGGTITTRGALTLSGAELLSAATLDNQGAATLANPDGSNGLDLDSGAVFDNQAGSSFTVVASRGSSPMIPVQRSSRTRGLSASRPGSPAARRSVPPSTSRPPAASTSKGERSASGTAAPSPAR